MNSETWLEKATRLQRALVRPGNMVAFDDDESAARERIKIALWLRREFSDEASRFENGAPCVADE